MQMIPLVTPAEIEAKVRDAGLTITAFLRAADFNGTNWYNWKKGKFSPTLIQYRAMLDLLRFDE